MALADSLQSLNEIDFNELQLDNIGSWPVAAKAGVWILVFVLIIAGGYFGVITSMQEELAKLEKKEISLKRKYKSKAHKALNLEAYKQQIEEIDENFGALLKQLPTAIEVPGLIDDISDTGSRNGLHFKVIEPQPEIAKEYYVELPINIELTGAYHDLGAFVSGVAGLPRIVTLHDYKITPLKKGRLQMSILAKTYRYKD